jgi:hypothetical protein
VLKSRSSVLLTLVPSLDLALVSSLELAVRGVGVLLLVNWLVIYPSKRQELPGRIDPWLRWLPAALRWESEGLATSLLLLLLLLLLLRRLLRLKTAEP